MNATILDGKKIAGEIKEELKEKIERMKKEGVIPGLAVVLVGDNPASQVYVRNKKKSCDEIGIYSEIYELPEDASQEEVFDLISRLNDSSRIHGILVQLPLPEHINEEEAVESIDPKKDVDCFHPENVGKIVTGNYGFLPCTPAGIMEILKRHGISVEGKKCVVVGRSNIVGKPIALMLLDDGGTVTVCHSKTKDLKVETSGADILVVAVGKPGIITSDMVKPGAVVVDVGINRLSSGRLVGDVDFEKVGELVGAITPVPGGVGPMTIAMLMKNTVEAAKKLNS